MNVTGPHWWSVNIGSGNGLVPSGNKPLPEPMLAQIIPDHTASLGHNEFIITIFLRVAPLVPGQSKECSNATEVTLMDMDKTDQHQTKPKHNKELP